MAEYRKIILPGVFFSGVPVRAFADFGHLGEVAGHSHWIGLAGLTVAGIGVVVLGVLRASGKDTESTETGETTPADTASDDANPA